MLLYHRYLSSMASVLNLSSVYISACFEYLFETLSFTSQMPGEDVDDQVMQVRRRTTATISSLCSSVPRLSSDAALMDKIFSSASAFLQQSSVLDSQRTNMLETLIGLADKLPDVSARRGLMSSIMQSTVGLLVSPAAQAMVASPGALLSYLVECAEDPSMEKLRLLSNFREGVISFVGE
jgi:hypothetical protein